MPYTLRALVARCDVFAHTPAWIADSAVIPLPQGFCMLPLTRALCEQFGPADRPWLYPRHSVFTHLPEALVAPLAELSRGGRLAYVEAEYHGGEGEQRSLVWADGEPREPEESSRAVNSALIRLGVERSEDADAFDTLGLGQHRSVEDWLESIPSPAPEPPPAPPSKPWWRFWR